MLFLFFFINWTWQIIPTGNVQDMIVKAKNTDPIEEKIQKV